MPDWLVIGLIVTCPFWLGSLLNRAEDRVKAGQPIRPRWRRRDYNYS